MNTIPPAPPAPPVAPAATLAPRIAIAALLIAVGNIASRALGIACESVIASQFGRDVDSFTAASSIPTIIYDLLVNGALSAALVLVLASTPRATSASSGRRPRR